MYALILRICLWECVFAICNQTSTEHRVKNFYSCRSIALFCLSVCNIVFVFIFSMPVLLFGCIFCKNWWEWFFESSVILCIPIFRSVTKRLAHFNDHEKRKNIEHRNAFYAIANIYVGGQLQLNWRDYVNDIFLKCWPK